jgi:hypothetical protein
MIDAPSALALSVALPAAVEETDACFIVRDHAAGRRSPMWYAAKIVLCYRFTTVGGAAIPFHSLSFVLRYATAIKVHRGQIRLREGSVATASQGKMSTNSAASTKNSPAGVVPTINDRPSKVLATVEEWFVARTRAVVQSAHEP